MPKEQYKSNSTQKSQIPFIFHFICFSSSLREINFKDTFPHFFRVSTILPAYFETLYVFFLIEARDKLVITKPTASPFTNPFYTPSR